MRKPRSTTRRPVRFADVAEQIHQTEEYVSGHALTHLLRFFGRRRFDDITSALIDTDVNNHYIDDVGRDRGVAMHMKMLGLTLGLVLGLAGGGQAADIAWVKQISTPGPDAVRALTIDPAGNLVAAGTLNGAGWVGKYDRSRNAIWTHSIMGATVSAVAADGLGNVFVTGSYSGTANFGGSTLTAWGTVANGFVASYGSQFGEPRWAVGWIGGVGNGVTVLPNGDPAVTGTATILQFGGCSYTTVSGSIDILVARMDGATGACKWARTFGGSSEDVGLGIAARPQGDLALVGRFGGTAVFGGFTLTSEGQSDGFVARIRPGGAVRWVRRIGGPGDDVARAVAVDGAGNTTVVGRASPGASFAGIPFPSAGSWDAFALQVDNAARLVWLTSFGGPLTDEGFSVAVGPTGAVYATGAFQGSAQVGGTALAGAGGWDAYGVRLDQDTGRPLWALGWGGGSDDIGLAVTVDAAGFPVFGGWFSGPARFGAAGWLTAASSDGYLLGVAE